MLCIYSYWLSTTKAVPCFRLLPRPCSVAGFGASLAKDMPFAALYWSLLEPTRATVLRYIDKDSPPAEDRIRPSSELLCANIASAGVPHTIHIVQLSAIYIHLCRQGQKALICGCHTDLGSVTDRDRWYERY